MKKKDWKAHALAMEDNSDSGLVIIQELRVANEKLRNANNSIVKRLFDTDDAFRENWKHGLELFNALRDAQNRIKELEKQAESFSEE